jgi:hypothetical protein
MLSGLSPDSRDVTHIFGLFRVPRIVCRLHPRPDTRAVAKKLAEPNRDSRRHRLSFLQDVVKMLTRNPEQPGDFRLGTTGGRYDFIAKQRTGMSWAAVLPRFAA